MKRKMDSKTKILTAAVLCACTTLWVNTAWAQRLVGNTGSMVLVGNDITQIAPVEDKEVTMDKDVNNGEVQGVYGGYALGGEAGWDSSEVIVDGTMEANRNTVTINGGTVTGGEIILQAIGSSHRLEFDNAAVVGGFANYASENKVYIYDGVINTDVIGGYSLVSGNKNSSHLEIANNSVYVYGGSITDGNIVGAYVDGTSKDGNNNIVKNNSVIIENASIESSSISNGNIYGAWADDEYAKLEGNKVYIKDGANITTSKSGSNSGVGIFGAYGQGKYTSAINNIVKISGGTINANIYGGYANIASSNSEVSGNKVIITGGTIIGNVYAGDSNSGANISNNGIYISGKADLSEANLYGWDNEHSSYIMTGVMLDIDNYNGSVNDIKKFNNIIIKGQSDLNINTIDLYNYIDENWNEVCGVLSIDNSNLSANKIDFVNQLSIQNGATLKVTTVDLYNNYDLCGDLVADNSNIEIDKLGYVNDVSLTNSSANIKNLDYFNNLTIKNNNRNMIKLGNINGRNGGTTSIITTDSKFTADSIKDLKELNVDMTAINWEKDSAVIDVSGAADLTNTAISATGILAAAAGTAVQNGDRMSFIKAGTLTGASAANVDVKKLQIGFASEADVELQDGANSIDWVVTGATAPTEQTKIIGESRTAAVAFVNQGSDILNNAFGLLDDGKYGIKTFAAAHGNYSRYDTGSNLKVNGWSVLAGVGDTVQKDNGSFSWGVFYENGSGNYRTYNDYSGLSLEGFGNAVYNGGGAMARFRANNGTYAELGVRVGMLKNSLSNAVADGFGMHGGYDTETNYFGTHLGVGHIYNIDGSRNIDIYGKYFYTRHSGESFEILGDKVEFDDAESSRLRLGLRYNTNTQNDVSFYYGAAWDYEFNGKAQVKAADFYTGNPSLKGSTAMIEAGVHYAPDNSPWSIDFGLQGYGGKRDGFSGTMQVNYSFN